MNRIGKWEENELERKASKDYQNFVLIIEEILLTHGDQLSRRDKRGQGENIWKKDYVGEWCGRKGAVIHIDTFYHFISLESKSLLRIEVARVGDKPF